MDNFTMNPSSADEYQTKKELKKLNKRISDLERVVFELVFMMKGWSENQTNSKNP